MAGKGPKPKNDDSEAKKPVVRVNKSLIHDFIEGEIDRDAHAVAKMILPHIPKGMHGLLGILTSRPATLAIAQLTNLSPLADDARSQLSAAFSDVLKEEAKAAAEAKSAEPEEAIDFSSFTNEELGKMFGKWVYVEERCPEYLPALRAMYLAEAKRRGGGNKANKASEKTSSRPGTKPRPKKRGST